VTSKTVLYFDLASPYAYLAVERAGRVLGAEPELQPVLVGAIFAHRGYGSWALTDQRAAGEAEIERRARAYGLPPVVWPPDWPANSLAAMRAAIVAQREGRTREFALAAYRAAFVEGRDLGDPAVLADLGVDLERLQDPAVKQALREATDAAIAAGVRGVPTIGAGGRLYFGDDQLEHITVG
jgi:2-hydroxychromene-2-carboxylate isomerase